MERPALKRLLSGIQAARVDCAVVYKVDRPSRSIRDLAMMMNGFDKRGVSFVSVTQQRSQQAGGFTYSRSLTIRSSSLSISVCVRR